MSELMDHDPAVAGDADRAAGLRQTEGEFGRAAAGAVMVRIDGAALS